MGSEKHFMTAVATLHLRDQQVCHMAAFMLTSSLANKPVSADQGKHMGYGGNILFSRFSRPFR